MPPCIVELDARWITIVAICVPFFYAVGVMADTRASTVGMHGHLGMDRSYRDRVSMKYYEGGHMMYTSPALLQQLKRDIATFIQSTQNARTTN